MVGATQVMDGVTPDTVGDIPVMVGDIIILIMVEVITAVDIGAEVITPVTHHMAVTIHTGKEDRQEQMYIVETEEELHHKQFLLQPIQEDQVQLLDQQYRLAVRQVAQEHQVAQNQHLTHKF